MAIPEGYKVSKVNIQDPRYGSPNYRHVVKDPSGKVVSRPGGHLNRESAVQTAHDHARAALSPVQFTKPTDNPWPGKQTKGN